jgi:hypothetical protein
MIKTKTLYVLLVMILFMIAGALIVVKVSLNIKPTSEEAGPEEIVSEQPADVTPELPAAIMGKIGITRVKPVLTQAQKETQEAAKAAKKKAYEDAVSAQKKTTVAGGSAEQPAAEANPSTPQTGVTKSIQKVPPPQTSKEMNAQGIILY